MKRNILNCFYCLLSMLIAFTSCNSDPEYFELTAPDDQMNITASTDSLILDLASAKKEAIKFTWNDAQNRGEGTQINYRFRLYQAENENKVTDLINLGTEGRSYSYTYNELNQILTSWGVLAGDEITLVAEVIAEVENTQVYKKPEISLFEFKVTGYDSNLYLFYTSGESVLRVVLNADQNNDAVYRWKGELPVCNYWFSTNKEVGYPAYVKGVDESSLALQLSQGGSLFEAKSAGIYNIELNLEDMKISTEVSQSFHLYMVKVVDGTESTEEIKDIDLGSNVFNYTGELIQNTQIRFSTNSDGSWPSYVPDVDGSKLVLSPEGSNMLTIEKSGFYTITANIAESKLICLDLWKIPNKGLWPIGDVLADIPDWNLSSPVNVFGYGNFTQKDLKNHPEVWSFTLNFKENTTGEGFKILTVPSQWTDELVPKQNGIDPCDQWTEIGQKNVDGVGDWKWHPNVNGAWTIELDLHAMKLRMIRP